MALTTIDVTQSELKVILTTLQKSIDNGEFDGHEAVPAALGIRLIDSLVDLNEDEMVEDVKMSSTRTAETIQTTVRDLTSLMAMSTSSVH